MAANLPEEQRSKFHESKKTLIYKMERISTMLNDPYTTPEMSVELVSDLAKALLDFQIQCTRLVNG